MKEVTICFETANLAEEKGYKFKYTNINDIKVPLNIPTQSSLQKWLRDMHDIHISINIRPISREFCGYVNNEDIYVHFKSYEEALESCLQEGLKIIK